MTELILGWLDGVSAEVSVFIISMLPIVELRGAIPYAELVHVPWRTAYVLAVLGNMLPIIPILLYLGPVSRFLGKLPTLGRFFEWLFIRTRRRSRLIERYGAIGLALFVAVPLPITGAWTGSMAAFLLGIPFKKSFPAILLGVLLAGVVVTLAVQGVINLGRLVQA